MINLLTDFFGITALSALPLVISSETENEPKKPSPSRVVEETVPTICFVDIEWTNDSFGPVGLVTVDFEEGPYRTDCEGCDLQSASVSASFFESATVKVRVPASSPGAPLVDVGVGQSITIEFDAGLMDCGEEYTFSMSDEFGFTYLTGEVVCSNCPE